MFYYRLVPQWLASFSVTAILVSMTVPSYGIQSSLSLDITLSNAPTYSQLYAAAAMVGKFEYHYSKFDGYYWVGDEMFPYIVTDDVYEPFGSGQIAIAASASSNLSASASAGAPRFEPWIHIPHIGVHANGNATINGNVLSLSVAAGMASESGYTISQNTDYEILEEISYFATSTGSAGAILHFDEPFMLQSVVINDFDLNAYISHESITLGPDGPAYYHSEFNATDPATYVRALAGDTTILSGSYGINQFGRKIATGDFSVVDDEFVIASIDPLTLAAGDIEFGQESVTRMPGDYNLDNIQNVGDIDLLAAAILSGQLASPEPGDPENEILPEVFDPFDLNTDDVIDSSDMDFFVHLLLETEYGDANLDGAVDGNDYVFALQNFGDTGGWSDGDFDGDGYITGLDLMTIQTYGEGFSWADFDNDGYVGSPDFSAFLGYWGTIYNPVGGPGDFNWDGLIDGADYSFFIGEWNPPPPGIHLIPEPTTFGGLVFGQFILIARRNK